MLKADSSATQVASVARALELVELVVRGPVEGLSLAEISRDFAGKSWGEYYGPGQPLLDF